MADEAREKCAVAAIVSADGESVASELLFESLYALQHRGVEASGMATLQADGHLKSHCELGLVKNVYDEEVIRKLGGIMGIGHNRYSTSGSKADHPQPFTDKPIGFALAHNGNLPDTDDLADFLDGSSIHSGHMNDSEMAGSAIAQNIRNGLALPDAVERAYPLLNGAFSCVAMHDGMVAAFRDPKGIRPLAFGSFDGGYAVASETAGLDIIDSIFSREVRPGEMVMITADGVEARQLADEDSKLDMFEFVYFARPDSMLYGQRVNEVRRRLGQQLAEQHGSLYEDTQNVLVVPVPDTSVPSSKGYARSLGLEQDEGIVKNRYIGRTFIQPTNARRHQHLRRKHNIIPEVVKGRDVILVDDSIVRLNTLPRLVRLAKESGARSVSALIASAPVRFPDYYGMDTPKQGELAAATMTVEQMRQKMDCHYLGFLSLDRMVKATGMPAEQFNLSCFTGEYPINIGRHAEEISTPISMEYVE